MTGLYQPYDQVPRFPDGEPITLGPFNEKQAPSLQCENCGGPITVGQKYTVSYRYVLGCGAQTGRLVPLSHEESNKLDEQGQVKPVIYHDDCSAEYAHDNITKEPCGIGEGIISCSSCGVEFYVPEFCPHCQGGLDGADEEDTG